MNTILINERRLKWAAQLLTLSLFMVFSSTVYQWGVGRFGRIIPIIPTLIWMAALPMAYLSFYFYSLVYKKTEVEPVYFRFRIGAFITALALLTLFGLIKGNLIRYVFGDIWIYAYILCFILLGRFDRVWEDIEKPLLIIFWIGFALTITSFEIPAFSMEEGGVLNFAEMLSERSSAQSLGYVLSRDIGFWPILLLLSSIRSKWNIYKILGLCSAIAYLALQIYFQKRAPSVRVVAYMVILTLLIWSGGRRFSQSGPILLLIAGLVCYGLASSTTSFSLLIERFMMTESFEEIDRIQEANMMLDTFQNLDWAVGRGMGGYFVPGEAWSAGMTEINKAGDLGRPFLHIGILLPLLKGGVVFAFIFYSFCFPPVYRKGWLDDNINLLAIGVVFVYVGFMFIEGAPTSSIPFEGLVLGLCCGRFLGFTKLHSAAPIPSPRKRRFFGWTRSH